MGDPCYEYFVADMAGLCGRRRSPTASTRPARPLKCGTSSKMPTPNSSSPRIRNTSTRFSNSRTSAPTCASIIVADMRAMFLYRDDRILSFEGVKASAASLHKTKPGLFERRIAAVKPEDVAVFVYTSGTTGAPKAAMITHRDLMVGMVNTYLQGFPELEHGHPARHHASSAGASGRALDEHVPDADRRRRAAYRRGSRTICAKRWSRWSRRSSTPCRGSGKRSHRRSRSISTAPIRSSA